MQTKDVCSVNASQVRLCGWGATVGWLLLACLNAGCTGAHPLTIVVSEPPVYETIIMDIYLASIEEYRVVAAENMIPSGVTTDERELHALLMHIQDDHNILIIRDMIGCRGPMIWYAACFPGQEIPDKAAVSLSSVPGCKWVANVGGRREGPFPIMINGSIRPRMKSKRATTLAQSICAMWQAEICEGKPITNSSSGSGSDADSCCGSVQRDITAAMAALY
jgi:hypothetical protein